MANRSPETCHVQESSSGYWTNSTAPLQNFSDFGSITYWGSNQYPLDLHRYIVYSPRNHYKLWREEIITENNEVIKRIVA